ncbi:DUF3883 domain-containing protein [Flavobacterium sp. F-65]|uniref:DUF3883 domain-containing protein n=1 Tax=Flavobacterium pisciphilum TaxID=2893755 RepID=A0ABS8MTM7_9FLAO|nr:DUF3883 domain-containing protein [Flavobacterium sp. F-65]MCC9072127.1 DUF3883 domain-containing protein [Flavobacterium sp. F-65]
MEANHKLTLIISYYLSRFNDTGFRNLGYTTWDEAFKDISIKLNVKESSVKNWRDEFDPIHGHRVGWYQRPMSPSRVNVVNAFEGMSEEDLREIILDILNKNIFKEDQNLEIINTVISDKQYDGSGRFILRGPTGKKAEDYFIQYHKENGLPIEGILIDTREKGCGYDFEIKNTQTYFVEIKGINDASGGIVFTSKEWLIAKRKKEKYFLIIVSNLNDVPQIKIINNPAKELNPKKNIFTTIQINWSISGKELNR